MKKKTVLTTLFNFFVVVSFHTNYECKEKYDGNTDIIMYTYNEKIKRSYKIFLLNYFYAY